MSGSRGKPQAHHRRHPCAHYAIRCKGTSLQKPLTIKPQQIKSTDVHQKIQSDRKQSTSDCGQTGGPEK